MAENNQFHLRRIYQSNGEPEFHQSNLILLDELTKFGRNPEYVDVVLNSTVESCSNMISRKHAYIMGRINHVTGGYEKYLIEDHSLNGTYVNDRRINGITELHLGDVVKFGHMNGAAVRAGQVAPQANAEFSFVVERAQPKVAYMGFGPNGKRLRGIVCRGNQDRLFLMGEEEKKEAGGALAASSAPMTSSLPSSSTALPDSLLPSATATTPLATQNMINWAGMPPEFRNLQQHYQYILPLLQNPQLRPSIPLPDWLSQSPAFNTPPLSSASNLLQFPARNIGFNVAPFDMATMQSSATSKDKSKLPVRVPAPPAPAAPSPPMECDSSVPSPPKISAVSTICETAPITHSSKTSALKEEKPRISPESSQGSPSPSELRKAEEDERKRRELKKQRKEEKKRREEEELKREREKEKVLLKNSEPISTKGKQTKKSNELAGLLDDATLFMQRSEKSQQWLAERRRVSTDSKKEKSDKEKAKLKKPHRMMHQLSVSNSDESSDSDSEKPKKRGRDSDSDSTSPSPKRRKKKRAMSTSKKEKSSKKVGDAMTDEWSTCALVSDGRCRQPEGENIGWVQCGDCDKWYHLDCYYVNEPPPDNVGDEDFEFHCFRCKKGSKKKLKQKS